MPIIKKSVTMLLILSILFALSTTSIYATSSVTANIAFQNNEVHVSGIVPDGNGDDVFLLIGDTVDDAMHIDQTKCSDTGEYSLTVEMPEYTTDGLYSLRVTTDTEAADYEGSFYYEKSLAVVETLLGKLKLQFGFKNDYLSEGENVYRLWGTNTAAQVVDITLIGALYEDNRLIKTIVTDGGSVNVGESFSAEGCIDVGEFDPITTYLKVFAWDGVDTMVPIAETLRPKGVEFSYQLDSEANTSAAVYDGNGVLVRTLWSNEKRASGRHSAVWDGIDDCGNRAVGGEYTVKLLTNNVNYDYIGIIGNTSAWESTATGYNGYSFFGDFDYYDGKMYYTQSYMEGYPTVGANFSVDTPQMDNYDDKKLSKGYDSRAVTTDGERVYYATVSPYGTRTFIYAYDLVNDKEYSFENGKPYPHFYIERNEENNYSYGQYYRSAINILETEGTLAEEKAGTLSPVYKGNVGGLEVEKEGEFLYASYNVSGTVYVLDKLTGAKLYEMDIAQPKAIAIDEAERLLWVAHSNDANTERANTITCYSVAADGTLSYVRSLDLSFSDIVNIALSPSTNLLAVSDGGSENKIKVYDLTNDTLKWSYGSGESYYTDATVKEDKLDLSIDYISQAFEAHLPLEFEDEHTLWFGENCSRAGSLVYSNGEAKREDTIIFLRGTHSLGVNWDDQKKVYSTGLELVVDYSKLPDDATNCWTVSKNYRRLLETAGISPNSDAHLMENAFTAENGRTYCTIYTGANNYIYELSDTEIRCTGVDVTMDMWYMDKEGNLFKSDRAGKYYFKDLISFDENNNPVYSEERLIADTGKGDYTPVHSGRLFVPITESGYLAALNPYFSKNSKHEQPIFHLGGIDLNGDTTSFKWLTAQQGAINYLGDYPTDGVFEVGNGTWYTASCAQCYGDNIIFHCQGEGYRQAQTNKFYHYTDDGLLVGIYGAAAGQMHRYGETLSTEGLSGNAFDFYVVDGNTSDEAFLLQNDESRNGGVVAWRITGFDSIKTTDIPIKIDSGLRKGWKWEYYEGINIVNTALKDEGIITELSDGLSFTPAANSIIRYSGYIKSDGLKGIRIISSSNVKVTIDDLVAGEYSSGTKTVNFDSLGIDDGIHSIVVDIAVGEGTFSYPSFRTGLDGTSTYRVVLDGYIFRDNDEFISADSKTYDLLEGLPFDATLTGTVAGWNIPAESANAKIYTKTNQYNDAFGEKRDINIYINSTSDNRAVSYAVTRNLPAVDENINGWTVDAMVATTGRLDNADSYNSAFGDDSMMRLGKRIEILDGAGKVISRFNWGVGDNSSDSGYWSYANGEKLFMGDTINTANQGQIRMPFVSRDVWHQFSIPNRLVIKGSAEGIYFSYCGEEIGPLPVFEEGADWSSPTEIRVKEFVNSWFNTQSIDGTITFTQLDYTVEL